MRAGRCKAVQATYLIRFPERSLSTPTAMPAPRIASRLGRRKETTVDGIAAQIP